MRSPAGASPLHGGAAFKLQLLPWAPACLRLCPRPSDVPPESGTWLDLGPALWPQPCLADAGHCQGTALLTLLWRGAQWDPCPACLVASLACGLPTLWSSPLLAAGIPVRVTGSDVNLEEHLLDIRILE